MLKIINVLHNELMKGTLPILEERLNIHHLKIPAYFISTEHDHIAPWQTTFKGAHAMQGPATFVLGGSGHIAGVVNPPCNQKYDYKIAPEAPNLYENAQAWLAAAQQQSGSWWTHWGEWLKSHSGKWVAPRKPGVGLAALQDAPGDYVKNESFKEMDCFAALAMTRDNVTRARYYIDVRHVIASVAKQSIFT